MGVCLGREFSLKLTSLSMRNNEKKRGEKMLSVGDVFCYYMRDFNQYGACQILGISEEVIYYVVLDIRKDAPLTENDLQDIRPLADFWDGSYYQRYSYLDRFPESYIYVGRADPVLTELRRLFSRKWPDGIEHVRVKEWNEIPKEESAACSKYNRDLTPVIIGSKTYAKNHRNIDDEMLAEMKDYSELDALPCLDGIYVDHCSDELFAYLRTRHLVRTFYLGKCRESCLDLRDSFFSEVSLDITGVQTLYLNDRVIRLRLAGKADSGLRIYAKNNGARISLNFSAKNSPISSFGLREIEDLTLYDFHELDALVFAEEFTNLRKMWLKGCPGIVRNIGQLCKIATLEDISIYDMFGFSSEEIAPFLELNNLYRFWMSNVPEEPGKYARREFKNKVKDLSITKLRKPEWIIDNANNPFLSWDGDAGVPSGAYKKACLFYKELKKDILAASDREGILLAVKNYTEAFNQLDKRFKNFIETTQAEDLFQVVDNLYEEKLADHGIVSIEDVRQVIEENRNW